MPAAQAEGRFAGLAPGVRRRLSDIPASAWGIVIGKEGATRKALATQFGVRIIVPRRPDGASQADGAITVEGSTQDAVDACCAEIYKIVKQKNRKSNSKAKSNPFPELCKLCGKQINGLLACITHLGGQLHLKNVLEECPDVDESSISTETSDVVALLKGFHSCDQIRSLHMDFEWLRVDDRWLSAWDTQNGGTASRPVTSAPLLQEMLDRIDLDPKVPTAKKIPESMLPVKLPMKAQGKHFRRRRWPEEATSRLGVATLLKSGRFLADVDLVCGTSLFHALAGEKQRTQDDYYFECCDNGQEGVTWICLHVRKDENFDQWDAGHKFEQLMCPERTGKHDFHASSLVSVDEHRLLITSEIDAIDHQGDVVELRSTTSSEMRPSNASKLVTQLACNGSRYLLVGGLDPSKEQVQNLKQVEVAEYLESHKSTHIGHGQRTRYLLKQLFNELSQRPGEVVHMTFDQGKRPVFRKAPTDVSVVPKGMS